MIEEQLWHEGRVEQSNLDEKKKREMREQIERENDERTFAEYFLKHRAVHRSPRVERCGGASAPAFVHNCNISTSLEIVIGHTRGAASVAESQKTAKTRQEIGPLK
jgi:hypothetical protein